MASIVNRQFHLKSLLKTLITDSLLLFPIVHKTTLNIDATNCYYINCYNHNSFVDESSHDFLKLAPLILHFLSIFLRFLANQTLSEVFDKT